MSAPGRTFVIRPQGPQAVTPAELQALAAQLGLLDNDALTVVMVGDALHLTLTAIGHQRLLATRIPRADTSVTTRPTRRPRRKRLHAAMAAEEEPGR